MPTPAHFRSDEPSRSAAITAKMTRLIWPSWIESNQDGYQEIVLSAIPGIEKRRVLGLALPASRQT
jgi:hypothetical protein